METLNYNENTIESRKNQQEEQKTLEQTREEFSITLKDAQEIPDYQKKQLERYGGSSPELDEQLKKIDQEILQVGDLGFFEKFSPGNIINKTVESFKKVQQADTPSDKLEAMMKLPGVTGIKDNWATGEVTRYGPFDFLDN